MKRILCEMWYGLTKTVAECGGIHVVHGLWNCYCQSWNLLPI